MKQKITNYALTGFIAVLFAGIGLYLGNSHVQAATTPNATQNTAASEFFASTLPDTKNQPQALAQWKGKVLLVNFWATWCHPCVQEMPELSALQAKGKIPNLQIIGIGIDSADNIQQFSTKYKISYPLYVGGVGGSELLRKMGDGAGGLPYSLLIGPDGEVKKTYIGSLKLDQVKRDIAAL